MALAEVCPQYAACPGGEDAVLKTVDPKGFAGSNPVCSAEGSSILSRWPRFGKHAWLIASEFIHLLFFLFTNRVALDYRDAEDRNHRNMKLDRRLECFWNDFSVGQK